MKPGLAPGVCLETRVVVTREMCPHFDGVLIHAVYSTWTLVHQIEVAGRKLLAPHLEEHEEGVGVHVSVDHTAPAPLGSTVVVRAVVESVDARRLVCAIAAHCDGREIATGRFTQAIVAKEKFAAALRRLART